MTTIISFILEDTDNQFYNYCDKKDNIIDLIKTELENIEFCKVKYIYEISAGEKIYIDRDYGSEYEYKKRRYVILGNKYEDSIFEPINEMIIKPDYGEIPFQIITKNKYNVILYNINKLDKLTITNK